MQKVNQRKGSVSTQCTLVAMNALFESVVCALRTSALPLHSYLMPSALPPLCREHLQ